MATEATVQVLDSSVDAPGLSVVTAHKTTEALRAGTIYNPATLAGGVPVHFHALQNGQYLALFQTRWTNAVVGTRGPQSYSSYVVNAQPSWAMVSPASGVAGPVREISSRLAASWTLNGACSRVDYLFTVGMLSSTTGLVQLHRVNRSGTVQLEGEELFSFPLMGCYVDGTALVVIGVDDSDRVCMARRRWGRIGAVDAAEPWYYRGEKGWLPDIDYLSPAQDNTGTAITSIGPVSVGWFGDRMWMVTVVDVAGDYQAKVYTARAVDAWRSDTSPIALGNASTYLGGTLYLQPQLPYNPSVLPAGVTAAIPCVISSRWFGDGDEEVITTWGLWPTAPLGVGAGGYALVPSAPEPPVGQRVLGGDISTTMRAPQADLSGLQFNPGVIAAEAKRLAIEISGKEHPVGAIAASMKKPTASVVAREHPAGAVAANLKKATAAFSAKTVPVFVGSNSATGAASVAIPAHVADDLIVIFAADQNSTTVPSKPSASGSVPAFVDIDAHAGANSCSSRTAYFVATGTHTSGTWANATQMIAVVIRGQNAAPIGGHVESGGTRVTGAIAPAVTMSVTDGTSLLLHFFVRGEGNWSTWSAAPTGYTKRTSDADGNGGCCLDTKNVTTSDGAVTQETDGDSSVGYRGATVEILA